MNEYDDDTDGPPGASDDLLRCRCFGIDRRTHCERDATQEDGYCDSCRCPHGGCDSHGDESVWRNDLWLDDPVAFMAWFADAVDQANRCMLSKSDWHFHLTRGFERRPDKLD